MAVYRPAIRNGTIVVTLAEAPVKSPVQFAKANPLAGTGVISTVVPAS